MSPEIATEAAVEETGEVQGRFIVDAATDRVLRLHLDTFQGPLEVLLYLIKAQEIDIFDIPIAKITDQYLQFIELLEKSRLEVVGDYLVIAATLIQIKSKMLIPAEIDEDDEDEIDEGDPRLELVEKLIAYRKYRDVASRLAGLESERLNSFTRNVKPEIGPVEDEEEEYIEVSLFDLTQAFKGVIRFLHQGEVHEVEAEVYSVDEKIEYVQSILDMQNSIAWTDLFRICKTRVELICAFLAILELCKMEVISAHQHATFGDIRIFKKAAEANVA